MAIDDCNTAFSIEKKDDPAKSPLDAYILNICGKTVFLFLFFKNQVTTIVS